MSPLLPSLLVFPGDRHRTPTALMVQGYQVAMTRLRDQGDLDLARIVSNRAVEASMELPSIDDHACALFGQSRVAVDSAANTSDTQKAMGLLNQAHVNAERAAGFAGRCRPIIRAILLMNQGETMARSGDSSQAASAALDQAVVLAGRHS